MAPQSGYRTVERWENVSQGMQSGLRKATVDAQPAPAESLTERMGTVKPVGAPLSVGSWLSDS
jgi:hypothetical protein